MCHELSQRDGFCFISILENYAGDESLIGTKLFKNHGPKEIISMFFESEYNWRQNGNFATPLLEVNGEKQQIGFTFNIVRNNYFTDLSVFCQCRAGYHVFPFSQCSNEEIEILYKPPTKQSIIVPVLFTTNEVVNFDGKTVSVKTFRVPLTFDILEHLERNKVNKESIDNFYYGIECFQNLF